MERLLRQVRYNGNKQEALREGATEMADSTYTLSRYEEVRFNALMRASYRKVFSMAYRLSGDRTDAEDLTQEAYYRAYRSFADFEGDRPFENWIYRIVTRLFLDLIRNRRRRVQSMSYDAPVNRDSGETSVFLDVADSKLNPEQTFLSAGYSEELEEALSSLTPDQRMLLLLADVECIPYRDIAEMLDKPIGTIRSRLHRTHRMLKKRIQAIRDRDTRERSTPVPGTLKPI